MPKLVNRLQDLKLIFAQMHVHSPQIHEPTTRSRTWINLYVNTWSQARVVKSCPNGLRSPPPFRLLPSH